jgi:hypothetical protein
MDIPKMQRIEKLIGSEIYNAPLPAYIAENNDKRPDHRLSPTKTKNSKFKRRFNQKGRKQGVRDN